MSLKTAFAALAKPFHRNSMCRRKLTNDQRRRFEPLEDRRLLSVDLRNWMADMPDAVRLSEISIPGTHDSMTYRCGTGLFTCSQHDATDTQDLTIKQQLEAGIRFLDIRLRKNDALGSDNWFFVGHHGIVNLQVTFDTVLKDVTNFLDAHPEETVLMRINTKEQKGFCPSIPSGCISDLDLLNHYLDGTHFDMTRDLRGYLYRKPSRPVFSSLQPADWYSSTPFLMPTLGDVRGKMVWFMDKWGDEDPTLFKFEEIQNSTDEDTYSDGTDVYTQALSFLDEVQLHDPDYFSRVGMTGQKFAVETPFGVAEVVNPLMSRHLSRDLGLRTTGIITMDFPEHAPQLITRIIEQNGPGRGTSPPLATTQMFVNVGGSAILNDPREDDGNFKSWKDDANVRRRHNGSSNTSSVTTTIDVSHSSIPANTPEELFQTDRWDPAGGQEMQWDFPVQPGDYQVKLYFAENFMNAPGMRTFDVAIEGNQVLNDYDIYADVGKHAGVVKSFTVTSDHNLDIDFGHGVDNPVVAAIEFRRQLPEVYRANLGGPELAGSTPWESDKAVTAHMIGNSASDVTATLLDGLDDTNEDVPTDYASRDPFTPNVKLDWWSGGPNGQWEQHGKWPEDPKGGVFQMEDASFHAISFRPDPGWRVVVDSFDLNNWGGGEISVDWSAWSPSGRLANGTVSIPESKVVRPVVPVGAIGEGDGFTLFFDSPFEDGDNELALDNLRFGQVRMSNNRHPSVPAGTPMELFRSSRWDTADGLDSMQFNLPVKPGDYEVRLYFAEANPSYGFPAFGVDIEGEPKLSNYQVRDRFGINTGVVESFLVSSDDNLDIDFRGSASFVNGIEIIRKASVENDDFTDAERIDAGALIEVDTTPATTEDGEPNHANVSSEATVWYNWTPTSNGPTKISTAGSNFDTVLAVYTGESVESLVEIAANDDAIGVQSEVSFFAEAGTSYQIALGGYRSRRGNADLLVTHTPVVTPPPTLADNALSFDGIDDYVTNNARLSGASGTWEAWVKKDDWSSLNDGRLFGNGISHPDANSFYVSLHDVVGFHFRYGGFADNANIAAHSNLNATTSLTPGWHHLAATWHSNDTLTRITTYVDGEFYAEKVTALKLGDLGTSSFIGGDPLNPKFDGEMDEVRVWNTARTQAEIKGTMTASLIDGQQGLAYYYKFDDGVVDSTSNGNNGTNIGGATNIASSAPINGRGFAVYGTDGDDDIRIWWDIDEEHKHDEECAFDTPFCEHKDFLNITVNGEVYETEYTPENNFETIFVFGGDGNDRIEMTPEAAQHWNAEFYGGEGDDTLIGAAHRYGSNRGGKDRFFGGPGVDTLQGGEGNDQLDGGPGSDLIKPFDDVDISGTTTTLAVRFDDEDILGNGFAEWLGAGTKLINGETYELLLREATVKTYFGDANLDGKFDTSDIVQIFKAAEFEDGIAGNSTWFEGDFNADGDFDAKDLELALRLGKYETRSAATAQEHDEHEHHPADPALGDDDVARHDEDHHAADHGNEPVEHDHQPGHPVAARASLDVIARDELFARHDDFTPNRLKDGDDADQTLNQSAAIATP